MSTEEIIIRLLCIVDERLRHVNKHPQAKMHPTEIVTIGLLFALKGGHYRAFYRWFDANYRPLFPHLLEMSRLFRALRRYAFLTDRFLEAPTFWTIIDSYGIELIHPRREGRSKRQIGTKGISNGRWIVGIKIAWLINQDGFVVDWCWEGAHEYDGIFRELATQYDGETITLSDFGFREKDASPSNLKHCEKGTWNERYLIERCFAFIEGRFRTKKIYNRIVMGIDAKLGYIAALFNCLLTLTGGVFSFTQFVV